MAVEIVIDLVGAIPGKVLESLGWSRFCVLDNHFPDRALFERFGGQTGPAFRSAYGGPMLDAHDQKNSARKGSFIAKSLRRDERDKVQDIFG